MMVQRYDLYLKIQSFWAIFMVYHGGTDANQNSGVGENDHIDKLNSICVRNRFNILPKCGLFEFFFVPLQPKGCETAPARQLMQASLLSLNRSFAVQRLRIFT